MILSTAGVKNVEIQCKISLFSFIFITLTVPFHNLTTVKRLPFQMINIYEVMKICSASSFALAKSLDRLMALALQTATTAHTQ